MPIKVAINGFGRIGRLILRSIIESNRTDIEVIKINSRGNIENNINLLTHDSVHGKFPGDMSVEGKSLIIKANGRTQIPLTFTSELDPLKLNLKDVDIAMECTGRFTSKTDASALIIAGAKKVIISAPAKSDVDASIVYGVNNGDLKADMTVISCASCTTNCLAPIVQVVDTAYGVERGIMLTIHSYTGDQRLVDSSHTDPRRARAAALNMIPTTTGAAKAIGLVIPHLKGKLDGMSVRVPTPNVSFISLDFIPKRLPTSVDEINQHLKKASECGPLKGILAYNDQPLVSCDFNHNTASSVFDATQTAMVDGGKMVRVCGWYDNEWGFSTRMVDTAVLWGNML